MTVLKCKMCGGDLNVLDEQTVCECEYCGTRQTVPKADDEKKLKLFARAGRLLRACEFDKAAGVYEAIVADFDQEAEAYWGLILCKYGIEYVDDPATGKKIPTCHRSSFDGVLDDANFELVMENADAISRPVYRAEAKEIERLRKGILEVSAQEEPYDVFICYKETDEQGDRTVDSLIAQDVYTALTERGYRVFFSRISLEDKLGQEYEPYIFAALHSARVMLAFGTSYENYDAVWVKNEWSRFLSLMARGEKKTLIPCYKDLDAYDMRSSSRSCRAAGPTWRRCWNGAIWPWRTRSGRRPKNTSTRSSPWTPNAARLIWALLWQKRGPCIGMPSQKRILKPTSLSAATRIKTSSVPGNSTRSWTPGFPSWTKIQP